MMEAHPYVPTFKCLLIGDKGVGKTSFINRHQVGSFTTNTIKIIGAEIHPITFYTCAGPVKFNVWDVQEPNRNGFASGNIYHYTQCAIIMFDVQSHVSYRNVPLWYERVISYCGKVPIVICGNKIESKCRGVLPTEITFHIEKQLHYCEISALSNYNFQKPFLYLASELIPDCSQSLITMPKLAPPEAQVDKPHQDKIEQEIAEQRRRTKGLETIPEVGACGKNVKEKSKLHNRTHFHKPSLRGNTPPTKTTLRYVKNKKLYVSTPSLLSSGNDRKSKSRNSTHSLIDTGMKASNNANTPNNIRCIST